jgi:two-component system chemotaxis response regulator CheB
VEALSALLGELPANLQAVVLVVLHTPSDSPGLTAAVLARAGALPVAPAHDGEHLAFGRVFVAPPDHHLLVDGEQIRVLRGPRENGVRPAADPLFRSAARSHGSRVAGVVLSGVLDDGTAGLLEIKHHGGLAIVQDPGEALFSGMPLSALQGDDVDHVLPAAQIAKLIAELASEPALRSSPLADDREGGDEEMDDPILEQTSEPAALTCPECGGALADEGDQTVDRYRCHVGHTFGAASLLSFQTEALERALWTAVRTLEETACLRRSMAQRAATGGLQGLEDAYRRQAARAERNADLIRGVLTREETLVRGAAAGRRDAREDHPTSVQEP